MDLYFQDELRAKISLHNGRLVVTGPQAEMVEKTLAGYRPVYGSDEEIYAWLPRIFKGYWHVDETS